MILRFHSFTLTTIALLACFGGMGLVRADSATRLTVENGRWCINGQVTCPGTAAEGLLMNVRMVNAVFEDANPATRPEGFDAEANADEFIARIPDYTAHGARAFTLCLQGGSCGYEGAVNSAFAADGSLRPDYLRRVRRVIEACDRSGAAVILTCFYQRQDQVLRDEAAVRNGVAQAAKWITESGFRHVALEIANEFGHRGFDHAVLRRPEGMAGLLTLAKQAAPGVLVAASGLGSGKLAREVAERSDFLLIHFNDTPVEQIPQRIAALRGYGKPVVCNEDDKTGAEGARAAECAVASGASWGLMLLKHNQEQPFRFDGAADDPVIYDRLKTLTSRPRAEALAPALPHAAGPAATFPPPESRGGWSLCQDPDKLRRDLGMDPARLEELKAWLLASDDRAFAAVVIRRGSIALQVERGNSAAGDDRRVASVSKAVCATVLAIASERSLQGLTPRQMRFGDPAFAFIPAARPLSDPRKEKITVQQLLNHTSGVCPEATGASNNGSWDYVLGHSGDARTARLAFDPGTACGYSTLAFDHAALICEEVTGMPYDEFAAAFLFRPLGVEKWTFSSHGGSAAAGKHPSHAMGMPARDLARIGYCMLRGGRWNGAQVIPAWFVRETAGATHDVRSPEMRFQFPAACFSHGWELPALRGETGRGIPADARFKPGSGGQLLAFVPSLDLVVARQTGGSGDWKYEEFLRLACAAVLADP
jgi:CubicO group peptidase (beta-lactamase class C family)